MNNDLKPIETIYNGFRFRSRLEARWAVFFDAMKIKWEYEPEGYLLSNGEKYLPDFYLPQLDHYAEVKPLMFSDADYSEEKIASTIYKINAMKMSKFAELTKIPTILLDGMPGNKLAYIVRVFDHKRPNKNQIGLGDFSSYDSSIPAYWDLAQDMNFYLVSLNEYRCRFFVYSSIISKPSEYDMKCLFDEIGSGILAARSTRFEFGENEWVS